MPDQRYSDVPTNPGPSRRNDAILDRRSMIGGLALILFAGRSEGLCMQAAGDSGRARLRDIEQRAHGRLGACVLDTQSNVGFGWRESERFAHCSSFKMSLAAMVLAMADHGEADLGEILRWGPKDMLHVSPVTEAHVQKGLSVEELARATLVTSDNTAANVLLRRFGGPQRLTEFWRSLGDDVSRLDRYEPELNETPQGTILDTTSPHAMARTTAALIHGAVLTPDSKAKLKAWMADVRTGSQRIRAGLPADWQSGDKTGTGIGTSTHTYVDIAYGGPVGRPPLVVTAYFEPARLVEPMDPVSLNVLADVGRVAAGVLSIQ